MKHKRSRALPHPLSSRFVVEADGAGDLAFRVRGSQLRVSAGLAPASPLSPPIRGSGHPICVYSVVGKEFMREAVTCQVTFSV